MDGFINLHNQKNIYLSEESVKCPHCSSNMVPKLHYGLKTAETCQVNTGLADSSKIASFIAQVVCTERDCKRCFLAVYTFKDAINGSEGLKLYFDNPETYFYIKLSEDPEELDPYRQVAKRRPFYKSFLEIYSQAHSAETNGLDQIAGIGYRKAVEFLIKDYAQHLKSDEKEKIIKMPLLQVIKGYLDYDKRLVEIATRAAWLGNDESHYLKKWVDRDISDLKKVIILTLQSIEHTEATNEYIKDMPEPI